jgi:hypothetical protein
MNAVDRSSTEATINRTWALLVALTVGAGLVAMLRGDGVGSASAVETVAVLAIAGVKARLILRAFMEVRDATPAQRRIADGALVASFVALAAMYSLA